MTTGELENQLMEFNEDERFYQQYYNVKQYDNCSSNCRITLKNYWIIKQIKVMKKKMVLQTGAFLGTTKKIFVGISTECLPVFWGTSPDIKS